MEENELIQRMEQSAARMRKHAVQMTYRMGNVGAHIGGGLSLIEIMAVLYGGIMRFDPQNMCAAERDRLIFSKGHGTLALYTAMEQAGILKESDLLEYKKDESFLSAHPSVDHRIGMDFASGSLGQGLSLGVGVCLALRRKGNEDSKVYVILGDGECDEGSVWEAAASASHFGLKNLVVVVDRNGLQYDGPTQRILSMDRLEKKWEAFGWETQVVDGHDVADLYHALNTPHVAPFALIADTVKGKGVSFMENNPAWHNGHLTAEQYEQAMLEVEK